MRELVVVEYKELIQAKLVMDGTTERFDALDNRRRRSDVRIQDVGDERLVLDLQSGHIHQLNATASFIWQQCDGNTPNAKIANLLVQQFEVSDDVAARDVAEVIEKLQELNLLCD